MGSCGKGRAGAAAASLALTAALVALAPQPAEATVHPSLQVTVTPIDRNATYTQLANPAAGVPARPSFLGYTVSIRNIGRSTVTQIRFAGATSVTDAQERATLNSIVGVSGCGVTSGGTAIDCPIGKLKSGESFPTFQVLFNTPVKDTATPTPDGNLNNCATTDCVSFSGRVFVAGNKAADGRSAGGNPNSPPSNFSQAWAAPTIALGTPSNTQVRSLVLAGGGQLFTSNTGFPTAANPFTTLVTVPPIGNTRTAALQITDETTPPVTPTATFSTFTYEGPLNCSNNLTRCFLSDITVPGTFSPFLSITLRQDISTIQQTAFNEFDEGSGTVPIESIKLFYTGGQYVNIEIPLCRGFGTANPIPNGPETHGANPAGLPCIAARKVWPLFFAQVPVDLRGDYEWTIYNVVNGSYRVR